MREFVLLYSHIKKKSFPGEKEKEKKIYSKGIQDRVQRSARDKICFFTLLKSLSIQYILFPTNWNYWFAQPCYTVSSDPFSLSGVTFIG